MKASSYPLVKIPPIIYPLLKKQLIANQEFIYKPSRKKKKKKVLVKHNDWWALSLGVIVAWIIRYLFGLQWNITALMMFMGAVVIILVSGFLLYRSFKDYAQPSLNGFEKREVDNEDKRKREIAILNNVRKRYQSRPLNYKLKKLLVGNVKALDPVKPDAQIGVSEKQFLSVLQQYFGNKVNFPDGRLTLLPGTDLSYTPDIVYYDSVTGLTIDIEIDEPYAGKTKEPHHCIDNDKDKNRDKYFLKRNWVVVRFAEEQVVKNPLGCAYYLNKVIKGLSGISYNIQPTTLQSIPMWDSRMSKIMASQQYREIYLEEYGLFQNRSS